jgi:preprotein translocase subunit Sss1
MVAIIGLAQCKVNKPAEEEYKELLRLHGISFDEK